MTDLLVINSTALFCFCVPHKVPCTASVTTVSGFAAPMGNICSGDLIFEDNFDTLDIDKWQHEINLGDGENREFQWYVNNRSNSYAKNGILYITPTLTSDAIGEDGLTSANINLHADGFSCTNTAFYDCEMQGSTTHIINPIRSAKIRTQDSFSFQYGRVEISARLPAGDWLFPGLLFKPHNNTYGTWPSSGEIDLMQSRGNRNLHENDANIGVEHVASTLNFGPSPILNAWTTAHRKSFSTPGNGWNNAFHRYGMTWSPTEITFSIDGNVYHTVKVGTGFWNRGNFPIYAKGRQNPWRHGTPMAPFDQEFYMVIHIAVGGTNHYFSDEASNLGGKPWKNESPTAATDFWNGRSQWLATWNLDKDQTASFQIDYVRVWAL